MIDPDNIQIELSNLPNIIRINNVPKFETEIYNLEDDKDYKSYITDIEHEVRKSFEYKNFIRYLREKMSMDKCAFLKGVSNSETFDIKIEIHHYPFTLRDVCEIVFRKRSYYNEPLIMRMTAKEVMILHYRLMIGLISLSETVHELYHSGRLFIPVDTVIGRYKLFIDYYKPFCEPEQLETIERIEKYTEEKTNDILNTTILEQNKVLYDIKDNNYALPQFNEITNNMINQIEAIKNNNYLLPTINDSNYIKDEKEIPIYFEY